MAIRARIKAGVKAVKRKVGAVKTRVLEARKRSGAKFLQSARDDGFIVTPPGPGQKKHRLKTTPKARKKLLGF